VAVGWHVLAKPDDRDNPRYFADQTYNFEAIRVLNDIASVGGDSADVIQAVGKIRTGNPNDWYSAWTEAGDRAMTLANNTHDAVSKATLCCARTTIIVRPSSFLRRAIQGVPSHGKRHRCLL
jgi:hypothetical protein